MSNYWIEKTGIFPEDSSKHDENYDRLMKNLYGHEFGKFLAETGLNRESSIKFLIDALTYVNDQSNEFDI
jgi:hypothetical protein